jgi:serine/threonine protein kinase
LVDVLQIGRNDATAYFYYVMELADDATQESRALGPELPAAGGHEPNSESGAAAYEPRTLGAELRRRTRLPFEQCLQLGLTLSLALGHLHRNGLIHRDVKPSNIIFVNGVPKLADIGLVTGIEEANTFVGTEGFVPPEGPNSAQADLYALGKVLYEAATGKDRQEFPEPFTRLGLDAESQALMELNTILLKACATDPKDRYGSAEEIYRAAAGALQTRQSDRRRSHGHRGCSVALANKPDTANDETRRGKSGPGAREQPDGRRKPQANSAVAGRQRR